VGEILANVKVDIIKGNLAEIGILVGLEAVVRGVEAGGVSGDIVGAAQDFARKHQTTIAVTGEQDMIINSSKIAVISNGHIMMGKISGTGCMCSSLIGSFCGAESDYLMAAVAGIASMGIAGEIAYEKTKNLGIGSFKASLMDSIYNLDLNIYKERSKIY
jgi:hydroxyethylthiazole kinase